MSMDEITSLISNVGFPIACVGCLAWYVKSLTETHKEEVKELLKNCRFAARYASPANAKTKARNSRTIGTSPKKSALSPAR